MRSKLAFWYLGICLVFALCLSIGFAYTNNQSSSPLIELKLPTDFVEAVSITNGKVGIMLGYKTSSGRVKAIQYSGANYEVVHIFEFVRP